MRARPPYPEPFELDPQHARIELEPPPAAQLPVALADAPVPAAAKPRRSRFGAWLIGGAAVLLAGALGVEAYDFVTGLWERNVVIGGVFIAIAAATGAAALGLAARELYDLRRMQKVERLRDAATRLLGAEIHGEVGTVIPPIEKLYRDRPELKNELAAFDRHDSDSLSDGERIQLFARTVLQPVDRQAYALVLKGARDVGVLTAVSPLGAMDGLIVLGRNLMLLRQIARLYGVRPGVAGTVSLVRRTLGNVAIAGVGELVTEHAAHQLGAGLMAMLSAKAGQGLTNGVLAARLGLVAMTQCRPVPFAENELPRLSHVRNELLKTLGDAAKG
ncbi:TIGR01620 family protein [Marinivivus vitaminiproducens]|uniref:TIGR01620 family protein n=1 Tax=Marinivivus vitaminiproducens TaxID=3035935 RepID=UPI00279F2494|nr:TIGR01620 family protein [Geminicoccaceae bacterium SCSIO 64248]